MAYTLKLTSKRQTTLPAQVCRELGIKPGDDLILEQQEIQEGQVWVLKAQPRRTAPWFRRLNNYAQNKSQDIEEIRASIGKGLGRER